MSTVSVEIKSRWNGSVIFTAQVDASINEGLRIKAAVQIAVKSCAYLGGADLGGADLGYADLRGAYLGGADLRGADLRGADLRGAKIIALVARITRVEDPYEFFAWRTDKGDFIKAGCQFMTPADYRAHVVESYPGTSKAAETLRIIDFIEASFAALPREEVKAEAAQ